MTKPKKPTSTRMPPHLRWDFEDPDLQDPSPRVLYHYTNAAGLTGIIASGCRLTATHHDYVNDRHEIKYGYDIATEVLESLDGIDPEIKALALSKTETLRKEPSFIACLSDSQNVLTQWRLYADETAGYCVGFADPKGDAYHNSKQESLTYNLLKCWYDESKLRAHLAARYHRKANRLKDVATSDRNEVLARQLSEVAWRYAQLAKHEHFEYEAEWRFVVDAPQKHIKYRLSRRGLTPYLFTDTLQLKEIWIGPAAGRPRKAMKDVADFLKQHGLRTKLFSWETTFRR